MQSSPVGQVGGSSVGSMQSSSQVTLTRAHSVGGCYCSSSSVMRSPSSPAMSTHRARFRGHRVAPSPSKPAPQLSSTTTDALNSKASAALSSLLDATVKGRHNAERVVREEAAGKHLFNMATSTEYVATLDDCGSD